MLIKFENIEIRFNGKALLKNLCFKVEEGEKVVLKGQSGSGKTSLLNVFTGFVRPASGEVTIDGSPLDKETIRQFRTKTAYLPQQLSFNSYKVQQFIEVPFYFGMNKKLLPDRGKILEYFNLFGLKPEILNSKMQDVSGGEKQRLALVSCLLLDRKILLLDEPTAALDKDSKKKVMDHLFCMKEITIISASHDPDWIDRCNKVINLEN